MLEKSTDIQALWHVNIRACKQTYSQTQQTNIHARKRERVRKRLTDGNRWNTHSQKKKERETERHCHRDSERERKRESKGEKGVDRQWKGERIKRSQTSLERLKGRQQAEETDWQRELRQNEKLRPGLWAGQKKSLKEKLKEKLKETLKERPRKRLEGRQHRTLSFSFSLSVSLHPSFSFCECAFFVMRRGGLGLKTGANPGLPRCKGIRHSWPFLHNWCKNAHLECSMFIYQLRGPGGSTVEWERGGLEARQLSEKITIDTELFYYKLINIKETVFAWGCDVDLFRVGTVVVDTIPPRLLPRLSGEWWLCTLPELQFSGKFDALRFFRRLMKQSIFNIANSFGTHPILAMTANTPHNSRFEWFVG